MLGGDGLLGCFGSGIHDHRRRQLAEERHKDYNEFLEQKSKLESEKHKKNSKRVTKVVSNYNELLNEKRIEEQKHRELNGFDNFQDMELNEETGEAEDPGVGNGFKVSTVGSFHCSNNKFVDTYITPRSRLLATHSSRLNAIKYREELRKQIEEKERMKAQERERIRLEEEELEHRVEAERLRMLREYEEEQRVRRKEAAEELKTREKMAKQMPNTNRDYMIGSTSPLSLLRSPSYMHLRGVRALSPSPIKGLKTRRSLASALNEQYVRTTQSTATQTTPKSSAQYKSDLTSAELSDSEPSSESEEDSPNDKQNKEVEFRKRVLSRLSEVRQMMESDHIQMMEQLRHQQVQD